MSGDGPNKSMTDCTDTFHAKLVDALEKSDALRRQGRAERIQWLSQHRESCSYFGPMDTMRVLAEAGYCFVDGHYVATLLLAVAYIEHTLTDELLGAVR
jgi:hypothetical protein